MRIATSLLTAVSATVAFATPAIAPPPAPIEPAALIKKADSPAYQNGFQQGFRDGHRDGLNDAHQFCREQTRPRHSVPKPGDFDRGYAAGYINGYNRGFVQGLHIFCHDRRR